MSKGLDKRKIEDALKRAAQAVRSGERDAAAGRFLSQQPDKAWASTSKKPSKSK
ncbi:MAG TPA: hypothetical protein VJ045_10040 [Hyphomicrobiaceae bacterium]|nr:hypothetical protein [Hyphomicrobiaceae bacterium]